MNHLRKGDNKKFDLKKFPFENLVKVEELATSEGEITATQIANTIQMISEVIVG